MAATIARSQHNVIHLKLNYYTHTLLWIYCHFTHSNVQFRWFILEKLSDKEVTNVDWILNLVTPGSDDEGRVHDDQLPAPGRPPQLLPVHHLKPGADGEGHWLHARWTGQTWTWSVKNAKKGKQKMFCST